MAMCTYLKAIDVKSLVHSKDSAEGKVEMLETIVKIRMDILLPLKSKLVQTNDPPWINQQLRVSFTAAKRILFKATGSCTVPLITLITTGKHAMQSSIISRSNIQRTVSRQPGGVKLRSSAVCRMQL